jgi:Uncharacterized conserved protein
MAKYVDGFVIPLKKKNLKAYQKMAQIGCNVWMKYGALDYYECVGANISQAWGTNFQKTYKLKSDETLIFAFVTYKSKKHRDAVNSKVHKDAQMNAENYDADVFDMKRFSAGEFEVIVKATPKQKAGPKKTAKKAKR